MAEVVVRMVYSCVLSVVPISLFFFIKQLTNALKDLNIKVQTSSLRARKQVIQDVIKVLPEVGKDHLIFIHYLAF